MYSKAIINRDLENHSPLQLYQHLQTIIDVDLGMNNTTMSQLAGKEINEKEMIYAKPIIDSKTERRNNVFIKIRVKYCDKPNKKLGESISTILIIWMK